MHMHGNEWCTDVRTPRSTNYATRTEGDSIIYIVMCLLVMCLLLLTVVLLFLYLHCNIREAARNIRRWDATTNKQTNRSTHHMKRTTWTMAYNSAKTNYNATTTSMVTRSSNYISRFNRWRGHIKREGAIFLWWRWMKCIHQHQIRIIDNNGSRVGFVYRGCRQSQRVNGGSNIFYGGGEGIVTAWDEW